MRVSFPWLSPHGYVFADHLYGEFARNQYEAVVYLARPDHLLRRLATPVNGRYLMGVFVPVGLLPLAAPALLVAAVQLPLNMISSWPYAHEIRYHYSAPIIPFILLSVIRALALFPPGSWRRRLAAGTLVVGIVSGQILYGSAWVYPRHGQRWWRGLAQDANERVEVGALLDRIPPTASVSAHYRFLPALCQRPRLYNFPETGPKGTWPDALLVEEVRLASGPKEREVFERACLAGGYRELARTSNGTVLLVRGRRAACERSRSRSSASAAADPISPPPARSGYGPPSDESLGLQIARSECLRSSAPIEK